ncbi:hypothetical protein KC887_08640, partial [Candidatus Kaiserbacteria bacterium]|nr:hypothetical protein [Candidatus Kaiserbacteria bacterium]
TAMSGWGTSTTTIMEGIANDWKVALGIADVGGQSAQQFDEAQNATETFSEAQARAAQDTSKSWLDSFLDLDFGGAVSTSFDTATTAVDEFNTDSNTSIAETVAGWQSTILNGLPSDTFTLPFSTATTEVSNWSAETTAAVNEAFGGISETAAAQDPFAALLASFNNNQIAVDEWGVTTTGTVSTTFDTATVAANAFGTGFGEATGNAYQESLDSLVQFEDGSIGAMTSAMEGMTGVASERLPEIPSSFLNNMALSSKTVGDYIPIMQGQMAQVIQGMVEVGLAAAPEFVGVGQAIGGGIATGIANSLDGIKAQIQDVISQAKEAAQAAAEIQSPSRLFDREIGQPMGYGVAQGIGRTEPAVSGAAVGLVSDALNKAGTVDTTPVGRSIGDGIRDGIEESAPHVRRVLIGLTTGIVAGAEEILEANSPSRVFHRLGVGIGQGLANGIRESSDNVFDALDGIIGEASRFGRLANDFASELAEKLAAPFESQISGVEDTIKTLEDELGAVEDVTQSRLDLYDQFLARATSTDDVNRLLSERANFLSEQSRHQDELTASLTAEQARLAQINAEIERSGEALARVEASQSQLDFIQQQQELLDLIRSSGVAFDGLPEILGINGDLASLTELAASAFEELVRQSNDALLFSAFTLPPIFDPAEIDALLSGLTGLTRDFAEIELTNITDQLNTIDEQIAQERFNLFTGQTDDAEASQRRIAELEAERLGLAEEYRAEQERILELQEKQQKLDFLEKQLNLLDLIDQNGLDKDAILQGLVFGADASLDDLLEAMSRITDALIGQAEDDLEIASPSKVFTRLGKNIPLGLANGITDGLGAIPGLV